MVKGSLPFAVAAVLISCSGDPTGDLRNGTDHLVASPSSIFMGVDSSKQVVIGAVDEQGNQLSGNFKLGAVTGPFTVEFDSTYAPVYSGGVLEPQKDPTSVRYTVTPHANTGDGTFIVTANGKQITIPIRIRPSTTDVTLSATSPALGDTVVATAEGNVVFTSASRVTVSDGTPAVVVGLSADSSQLKFLPGPGAAAGTVTISNTRLKYSPVLGPFDAVAPTTLTTPAAPVITAVFGTTTPDINQAVTITAPASIKFLENTRVWFGTDEQVVESVAADGGSIVFRPHKAGASGAISFGNVVLTILDVVPIVIQTTNTATVSSTVVPLTGTGAIATAPLIVIPDSGQTSGLLDAGATTASADCGGVGNHCRFYKFVLSETRTFKVTINWGNTADIGGYFVDDTGSDLFGDFACDAHGSGAAGQPESCTQELDAGTYYFALADFTAAAQNTTWTIAIEGQ